MRLLFEKGKQKELLGKEKENRNLTWDKFANELRIKFPKLKSFYYEENNLDDITFSKLKLKKDYERFIIKELEENWGQSKGGKNSTGNLKEIKIPERDKELAEFWGILLGDGNIQKITADLTL